tara:strand:+ start:1448 stop:2242 length:795 start_codon:yes stop_codon:yes gene_type:complete
MPAPSKKTSKKIRPLVAGNWKMNGKKADLRDVRRLSGGLAKAKYACEVAVCVPATLTSRVSDLKLGSRVMIGGQDCHPAEKGAHTGDISADMLKDAGAKWVILGHSERRAEVKLGGHGETSKLVRDKALAARASGLKTIICVGELLKERKSGDTLKVVGAQLRQSLPDGCTAANTVIAYEPVWAIGSGLTPSAAQVGTVHAYIRKALVRRFGDAGAGMRILYGGSVKPSNAAEIMTVQDVNGALVGGASLKAQDFLGIIKAYAL